jgi:hypothetical protein
LQEQIKNDLAKHFEVAEILIDEIGQVLVSPNCQIRPFPPEAAIFPLFLKAFKSFRACKLLIYEGYGQDALMLTRALFEILVSIEYIEQDVETRSEDFMRFYFNQTQEYIRRLKRDSPNSMVIASKFNTKVSDKWVKKTIKQRAIAVKRLREYELAYFLLSEVNHSGAAGLDYYAQDRIDPMGGHQFIFNAGPREIATTDAFHYAIYFFANILSAVTRLILPQLADLDKQISAKLPGELFMEQIKVRLSRILRMELPYRNFLINTDLLSRSLSVLCLEADGKVTFELKNQEKGIFISPADFLGYAVQMYIGVVQFYKLPNLGLKNINSYIF